MPSRGGSAARAPRSVRCKLVSAPAINDPQGGRLFILCERIAFPPTRHAVSGSPRRLYHHERPEAEALHGRRDIQPGNVAANREGTCDSRRATAIDIAPHEGDTSNNHRCPPTSVSHRKMANSIPPQPLEACRVAPGCSSCSNGCYFTLPIPEYGSVQGCRR